MASYKIITKYVPCSYSEDVNVLYLQMSINIGLFSFNIIDLGKAPWALGLLD